jgi:Protein of unknown function (DUF1573)
MKKAVLFFSAFLLTLSLFAQEKTVTDVIKFNETVYDFGKIKQGVPVYHDFMFTNISANPIVIESAVPSCGCTTPVKPEGAVPKGKENKIVAGFNAANPGPFNKSITVKVAGIDVPVQLIIKGEVIVADQPDKPKS